MSITHHRKFLVVQQPVTIGIKLCNDRLDDVVREGLASIAWPLQDRADLVHV